MRRGMRTLAAAGLVAALHLLAFLALSLLAPGAPTFQDSPVFEVMLAPPLAALRRRQAPGPEAPNRIPPRLPPAPQDLADDSARPAQVGPSPGAEAEAMAQAARLRSALRQAFGCSQPDMARLNETEREACLTRFAEGADAAPYRPPLMDADKLRGLDQAAARKAADRAYREATTPPLGIDTTGGGPAMNALPEL